MIILLYLIDPTVFDFLSAGILMYLISFHLFSSQFGYFVNDSGFMYSMRVGTRDPYIVVGRYSMVLMYH